MCRNAIARYRRRFHGDLLAVPSRLPTSVSATFRSCAVCSSALEFPDTDVRVTPTVNSSLPDATHTLGDLLTAPSWYAGSTFAGARTLVPFQISPRTIYQ